MAINIMIIDVRSTSVNNIIGAIITPGSKENKLPRLNKRAIIRAFVAEIILVTVVALFKSVIVLPGFFLALGGVFSNIVAFDIIG